MPPPIDPPPHMTSEAKRALSKTIRALRERLLKDLTAAAEGAYRLSLPAGDAKLSEAARIRRARLDAWIDEQTRALPTTQRKDASARFLLEVVKDAASTLLNRLVFLRLLEASGLRAERVVTGGWESRGYRDFREFAPELARDDESEGYATLLQLVYDDLGVDLPSLYGDVRLTGLIPVPAATLRAVVEALDDPQLATCWTDDMTLGWVYQYWNDPEREALDAKLNDGGKVEAHEIASKTQMFTERYMVDWLLQNSLGPMWLALCKKQGWTPQVEADGTLARLEERRVAWRAKRDAGEVELTALMPLETEAECRWAYYVPQPIPDDAVEKSRDSVCEWKILDPAVGSGHFLVGAFDLLFALYREEAHHRGEADQPRCSDRAIVERILEHNLHGIDLDPRAVQIAAAALWLKAQQTCAEAHPRQMNLVASSLRLSSLPKDDPARLELQAAVERETGIPARLTEQLLDALAGADHLGSLLKVDAAVDEAIGKMAGPFVPARPRQHDFVRGKEPEQQRLTMDVEAAKAALLGQLEAFLAKHTSGDDLGLRLRGEQLATGVRFVRLVQESAYDLVVANPPYQGTSKMQDPSYVQARYPLGKADLFAAFLLRGLELARVGGVSAMLTMRAWMFLKQYAELREFLLKRFHLQTLGDLSSGAFQEISAAQVVVSVAMAVLRRGPSSSRRAVALRLFDEDVLTQVGETERKRAATLSHLGRHEFDSKSLRVVPKWPLVYWWDEAFINRYASTPKLADQAKVLAGLTTGDNIRFVRRPWEVGGASCLLLMQDVSHLSPAIPSRWVPYIKGATGQEWFDRTGFMLLWSDGGLEKRVVADFRGNKGGGNGTPSAEFYFRRGIAVSPIGDRFSARKHRHAGVFSNMGSSVFPRDVDSVLCNLNSAAARHVIRSLNPGLHFEAGDANRIPIFPIDGSAYIVARLETAFGVHESRCEASVEFSGPGPSPWAYAQRWAQRAVDRPLGDPVPPYLEEAVSEPATDHLSFAIGVALGRFGAHGEGILDTFQDDMSGSLPAGTCFLDGSLEPRAIDDSLGHRGAEILHANWAEYGSAIAPDSDLRTWLRLRFFSDVHKGMYENRPIHWPLSSSKRTFVAFVTIHRWTEESLRALLAEHLQPALARLEGLLADVLDARTSSDTRSARGAERRHDQLVRWKEELEEFIANVEQCAEKGPPRPDDRTPEREVDVRYAPDLDDGVMINSAALWPLLEPQWKDPKKWWKELASAKGKKDYDWAHLAARYFPKRVDDKCKEDPSLAVAHGCFWRYHPENAYKWELRLQDEIGPDFTLDEEGSDWARAAFERDYPEKVEALVAAEEKRRERKRKKEREQQPADRVAEGCLPFDVEEPSS